MTDVVLGMGGAGAGAAAGAEALAGRKKEMLAMKEGSKIAFHKMIPLPLILGTDTRGAPGRPTPPAKDTGANPNALRTRPAAFSPHSILYERV
ncbi:hypothetical protein EVAR_18807_1 [Eumeta japonica]|uniref:Uncharacterized protein n=1 Tax=Eumeta variegata TaxID=151549 RepID=A0A4C1UNB0_EUMVA|nr:hypothetical protein EVAR_18807_1 [Eumeta japonica]